MKISGLNTAKLAFFILVATALMGFLYTFYLIYYENQKDSLIQSQCGEDYPYAHRTMNNSKGSLTEIVCIKSNGETYYIYTVKENK